MIKFSFATIGLLIIALSCTSTSKTSLTHTVSKNQFYSKLNDTLQKKFNNGIDFVASGNIPVSWNLELNFDKDFLFSTSDGVHSLAYASKAIEENNFEYYETNSKAGKLAISIFKEPCSAGKSQKVTVKFFEKEYTGCGQYIYNNQLNNSWVLEKMGNEKQEAKRFSKGLPVITINLIDNSINGHDGCNNLFGKLSVQGTRIHFGPIAQTKMLCQDNNPFFEKIVSEKISNQVASYFFKEGKLVLYLIDDSQLSFTPKL